ncbi:unknown [Ruminococcus sp. CAG:563]|nr:unknown [Ruminococcus sp. CAG:563]
MKRIGFILMLCNAKPPFLFDFHFCFSLVLNPSVSFAKREPSRFSADFMIES